MAKRHLAIIWPFSTKKAIFRGVCWALGRFMAKRHLAIIWPFSTKKAIFRGICLALGRFMAKRHLATIWPFSTKCGHIPRNIPGLRSFSGKATPRRYLVILRPNKAIFRGICLGLGRFMEKRHLATIWPFSPKKAIFRGICWAFVRFMPKRHLGIIWSFSTK